MGLAVSACGDHAPDPERTPDIQAVANRLDAACSDWTDRTGMMDAALAGDLGATNCEIAREERHLLLSPGFDGADRARLRSSYRRWQISGERDERALAAARSLPRDTVAGEVAYHGHLLRTASGPAERLLPDGPCWELNDIQLELVRVAIPDDDTAPCLEGWGIEE
ncbi:hypothetical protein X907_0145 [Glycocaulis alkaliphilus]|uniref:Uncharacterized protein n=1 Tax=Glycocaulis alkaliphilus TaxID=1434191 RepID=A0A3T0E5P5_9PROT|nr:hypothetical protein X907_0145 [Glycocaulis alkaliphilus]